MRDCIPVVCDIVHKSIAILTVMGTPLDLHYERSSLISSRICSKSLLWYFTSSFLGSDKIRLLGQGVTLSMTNKFEMITLKSNHDSVLSTTNKFEMITLKSNHDSGLSTTNK